MVLLSGYWCSATPLWILVLLWGYWYSGARSSSDWHGKWNEGVLEWSIFFSNTHGGIYFVLSTSQKNIRVHEDGGYGGCSCKYTILVPWTETPHLGTLWVPWQPTPKRDFVAQSVCLAASFCSVYHSWISFFVISINSVIPADSAFLRVENDSVRVAYGFCERFFFLTDIESGGGDSRGIRGVWGWRAPIEFLTLYLLEHSF